MYSALITSFSNMMAKLFEFKTRKIENIAQIELVVDKKDYKKAVDIAEKLIEIADVYKNQMTFAHKLKFSHLVEDFKKHN